MLLTRLPRAISMALVPITRTCVSDAAGRLRPLYRLRKRWRSGSDRADLPDHVRDRVLARLGVARRPRVPLVAKTLPVCLFIVLASVAPGLLGLSMQVLIPVIGVAVLLLISQLAAARPPVVEREQIVRAMVLEGRCPSCAYPLAPQGHRDGTLERCTECGAVWWDDEV